MLTNKNDFGRFLKSLVILLSAIGLTGCGPSGPHALQQGRKLIERGDYARAVEELQVATSLMSTNAQAWNYLGLACHRAGDAKHAQEYYEKALGLDRDLI